MRNGSRLYTIVLLNVCRKIIGRCRLGTKDEACGGKGVVFLCLYCALELVSHGAHLVQPSNRRADSQINQFPFTIRRLASLHCSGYSDSSDSAPLESKTQTKTYPRSAGLS